MLATENMQIVSRLLAITLDRWCSHRAAKKESIAAAPSARSKIAVAPSEVLVPPLPLAQIGYQHFTLHSILPAQALEVWTIP